MKSAADKMPVTQREVLERLANGEKRDSIAADLKIHRSSLDGRIARLYARLGAHTAAEALHKFLRLRQPRLNLFD